MQPKIRVIAGEKIIRKLGVYSTIIEIIGPMRTEPFKCLNITEDSPSKMLCAQESETGDLELIKIHLLANMLNFPVDGITNGITYDR
jgi:hypothetical protein